MKLKNKLPINFKTFFSLGEFDFLELGKSKEWIIYNFPNPDAFEKIDDRVYKSNIWTYGNIELHFFDDELQMIFSDYIFDLDGGEFLTLEKWFLEDTSCLKLMDVLNVLHDEKLDYVKTTNAITKIIEIELSSGVRLGFDLEEREDDEYLKRKLQSSHNEFEMGYFCWTKKSQ